MRRRAFLATPLALSACATESRLPAAAPLRLVDATELSSTVGMSVPCEVLDMRSQASRQSRQTDIGFLVGDDALSPHPRAFLESSLLRAVDKHESRDVLLDRLSGKAIELLDFDIVLGLRVPMSPSTTSTRAGPTIGMTLMLQGMDMLVHTIAARRWEIVRVRIGVRVNGRLYEGHDIVPYEPKASPSPVAAPAAAAVKLIVAQFAMYWPS